MMMMCVVLDIEEDEDLVVVGCILCVCLCVFGLAPHGPFVLGSSPGPSCPSTGPQWS